MPETKNKKDPCLARPKNRHGIRGRTDRWENAASGKKTNDYDTRQGKLHLEARGTLPNRLKKDYTEEEWEVATGPQRQAMAIADVLRPRQEEALAGFKALFLAEEPRWQLAETILDSMQAISGADEKGNTSVAYVEDFLRAWDMDSSLDHTNSWTFLTALTGWVQGSPPSGISTNFSTVPDIFRPEWSPSAYDAALDSEPEPYHMPDEPAPLMTPEMVAGMFRASSTRPVGPMLNSWVEAMKEDEFFTPEVLQKAWHQLARGFSLPQDVTDIFLNLGLDGEPSVQEDPVEDSATDKLNAALIAAEGVEPEEVIIEEAGQSDLQLVEEYDAAGKLDRDGDWLAIHPYSGALVVEPERLEEAKDALLNYREQWKEDPHHEKADEWLRRIRELQPQVEAISEARGGMTPFDIWGIEVFPAEQVGIWQELDTEIVPERVRFNRRAKQGPGGGTKEWFDYDQVKGGIVMLGGQANILRFTGKLRELNGIYTRVWNPRKDAGGGRTKAEYQGAWLFLPEDKDAAIREFGQFISKKFAERAREGTQTSERNRVIRPILRRWQRSRIQRFEPGRTEIMGAIHPLVRAQVEAAPLSPDHIDDQLMDIGRMILAYRDRTNQPGVLIGSDPGWGKTFVVLAFMRSMILDAKAAGKRIPEFTYVTINKTLQNQVIEDAGRFGYDEVLDHLELTSYQSLHSPQNLNSPDDVVLAAKEQIAGTGQYDIRVTDPDEPGFITPVKILNQMRETPALEREIISQIKKINANLPELDLIKPDGEVDWGATEELAEIINTAVQAVSRGAWIKGRVLILDEAHEARGEAEASSRDEDRAAERRKGSSRMEIVGQIAPYAEWNVYLTATPGENPAQLQYLDAMGMFEAWKEFPLMGNVPEEPEGSTTTIAGGVEGFAFAHGATLHDNTSKQGVHLGTLVKWPLKAHTGDASDPSILAINAFFWMQDRGLYYKHHFKVPEGLASVEFLGLPAHVIQNSVAIQNLRVLHKKFEVAMTRAAENSGGRQNTREISKWRENKEKRLLEAIKINWAVERMNFLLSPEGPNGGDNIVAIFTEYMAATTLNAFTLNAKWIKDHLGEGNRHTMGLFTWPEETEVKKRKALEEKKFGHDLVNKFHQEWLQRAEQAKEAGENPPRKPFSHPIVIIARYMGEQFPRPVTIPSPHDIVKAEMMPQEERQKLIAAGWDLDDRPGSLEVGDIAAFSGDYMSSLPYPYNLHKVVGGTGLVGKTPDAIAAWSVREEVKVFLASSPAAGTGLSLHPLKEGMKDRYMLLASLPWRPTRAIQVMGRPIRAGMKSRSIVEILLMPESEWEINRAQKMSIRATEMQAMLAGDPSLLGSELGFGAWMNEALSPVWGSIEMASAEAVKKRSVMWRTEAIAEDMATRLKDPYNYEYTLNYTDLAPHDLEEEGSRIEGAEAVEITKDTLSQSGEDVWVVSWVGKGAASHGIGNYIENPGDPVTGGSRAAEYRKDREIEAKKVVAHNMAIEWEQKADALQEDIARLQRRAAKEKKRWPEIFKYAVREFAQNIKRWSSDKRMRFFSSLSVQERTLFLEHLFPKEIKDIRAEWKAFHAPVKRPKPKKGAKKKPVKKAPQLVSKKVSDKVRKQLGLEGEGPLFGTLERWARIKKAGKRVEAGIEERIRKGRRVLRRRRANVKKWEGISLLETGDYTVRDVNEEDDPLNCEE